jgi:isopentenyldiphosphate isomerase
MENNEELLEIWDWDRGVPTGKSVTRALSHREGIPHEGVHLWIIRNTKDGWEVLFQHRSPDKKMYPDCLDITVGGHVPFGLENNKIQKEAYEEIGIEPDEESLFDLGLFRYEEKGNGIFHREFQRVYILLDNRPLDRYRFIDGEVTGIYAVPVKYLESMLKGDVSFSLELYDGKELSHKMVSRADFHPLLFSPIMKEYMAVLMAAVAEIIERGNVSVTMPRWD